MFRISAFAVAALAVAILVASPGAPAVARTQPTPSPTPTAPPADPGITKVARQQFLAWQLGSIDKKLYDEKLVPQLTDEKVADTSKHLTPLGALVTTTYVGPFMGSDFPDGAQGYIYKMNCSNGSIYLWMVITQDGKIATMFFRNTLTTEDITAPAATPPSGAVPMPPIRR